MLNQIEFEYEGEKFTGIVNMLTFRWISEHYNTGIESIGQLIQESDKKLEVLVSLLFFSVKAYYRKNGKIDQFQYEIEDAYEWAEFVDMDEMVEAMSNVTFFKKKAQKAKLEKKRSQ